MIDKIKYDELMKDHQDLNPKNFWAEYLGIDLTEWPPERLVRLYEITSTGYREYIRNLMSQLDDKDRIIRQSDLIGKERRKEHRVLRIRYDYQTRTIDKQNKEIQELKKELKNAKRKLNN